jgi:NADPH2:quinone reductase
MGVGVVVVRLVSARGVGYLAAMRAMIMRGLGEPAALELVELPDPVPGPGQVAIDVEASGCNFADVLLCRGKYQLKAEPPFTPGSEVAGKVRALGSGVSGFRVGQPVCAQLGVGGFASVVLADARRVQPLHDDMPAVDAAAMGVVYLSAWLALDDRARIEPGEQLLVQAAAGGVGLAAVQLGCALHARVIAAVGSTDKLAVCREHGAHEALCTADADWPEQVRSLTEGRGADVILESVGGDVLEGSLKCIAWAGRLVVVGFSSGDIPAVRLNRVMLKHIALTGLNLGGYHEQAPEKLKHAMQQLTALYVQGLRPPIHGTYRLEEAGTALTELAARRTTGKVVLTP